MIDKADWRIPYTASLRSDFRFIQNELRYAGLYGTVRRSTYYQGVCDLRPFGIDAPDTCMKALVDNDICLKGLSYGLLDRLLATIL